MYGYVRPQKEELKLRQYREFRSLYCGLCHSLKSVGGFFARFAVNYDFTFLALLAESGSVCDFRPCPLSPFRKKPCHREDEALRFAAEACLIFSYEKALDTMTDEKLPKRLFARFVRLLWRRGYTRAVSALPALADGVGESMRELRALETACCSTPDRVAHCFAGALSLLSDYIPHLTDNQRRIFREIFYFIGRYIYFLDALDDFQEDFLARRYNPLQCRFPADSDTANPEMISWTRGLLTDCLNHAAAAFELLPPSCYTEIAQNVLYLGLPAAMQTVIHRVEGRPAAKTKRRFVCEQSI